MLVDILGLKDARRCSYLGELDSNEEESDEFSAEFEFEHNIQEVANMAHSTSIPYNDKARQNLQRIKNDRMNEDHKKNEFKSTNEDVYKFFDAFNGMNKDSKNLILNKLGISVNRLQSIGNDFRNTTSKFDAQNVLQFSAYQSSNKNEVQNGNKPASNYNNSEINLNQIKNLNNSRPSVLAMKKNSTNNEYDPVQDNGGEVFDDETYDKILHNDNNMDDTNGMLDDIYDVMQRGNFNQQNKRDGSREKNPEEKSSWSSSEEALMKCEGLLAFQQLNGSKTCTANDSGSFSEIIYEETITESGFYYFIFANENEIRPNFMRVRFDLHKTVFDVSSSKDNCTNTRNCQLPLAFWSEDHIVLEVPENQPENVDSSIGNNTASSDPCHEDSLIKGVSSHMDCHRLIVAESVCTPRKPIYMMFVLLVPILILCFAYI